VLAVEREAAVLRMRFGLDDEEPKTLKAIGERLGRTRVRQIAEWGDEQAEREHAG
jgi:DNA-directed RNA polymerase sigma subunit (sigma70/sigma32)